MRRPYVAGNWKMNTDGADADALASAARAAADRYAGVDVGIAPPFVWLERVRRAAGDGVHVAAQNCNANPSGAHTGEVSTTMASEAGADTVILGHSERRHVYGETDPDVRAKVSAATGAGLDVILCVGETLKQRDAGDTLDVVRGQLDGGLGDDVPSEKITVAYEPVWAIGTGRTASPEQAQEVHAFIRSWWAERFGAAASDALRIQYGGSVKPANAAALMAMPDIDGALVGGASLSGESFAAIIEAAAGQ